MENFGEYITKEYGLSKKILSFLPTSDLLNARSVCRDWRKVVDLIISQEFSKLPSVTFSQNLESKDEEFQYWNNAKIIPQVVLKFSSFSGKKRFSKNLPYTDDIDKIWKPVFHLGESTGLVELSDKLTPTFIYLQCDGCYDFKKRLGSDEEMLHSAFFDSGGSTTLALPNIPGVHYTVISSSLASARKNNEPLFNKEEVCYHEDKGPVRCILFYESYTNRSSYDCLNKYFSTMMKTVQEKQDSDFAVGGGKINKIFLWKGGKIIKPDVCCIIIRGENIMAYSDILDKDGLRTEDMSDFFKGLVQRIGPTPDGAHRISIHAQCVDRPYTLKRIYRFPEIDHEVLELLIFKKEFLNVSVCGFLAGGEYGAQAESHPTSDHDDDDDATGLEAAKKRKIDKRPCDLEHFSHWQSTSIIILTFLNVLD
ncbi:uncharacterized protein LOC142329415 [Lycorma delicatula]|uniref:uncharacterized protein LOC142329415 n=1 Tax=Lycorma delicatula TaxID=130591 RepID=UPI003F5123B5